MVAVMAPVAATTVRASGSTAVRVVPARRVAHAGSTRAVLLYENLVDSYGIGTPANPRIRISRGGRQIFAETVPKEVAGTRVYRVELGGLPGWFVVRDLDGDGEPEVSLLLFWGGTQCCYWSRIYRFDAARNTYVPTNHFWGGNRAAPSLRDLNGDGRLEFVSEDDRFAALTAYVGVVEPIRLWSYDHGTFNDITRRYPKLIQKDAVSLWRLYLDDRRKRPRGEARYILAAWAADKYMLGQSRAVDRTLAQALRRGDLVPGPFDQPPRNPVAYIHALKHFLRKTGYIQ